MKPYVIRQGDYLAKLAWRFGFDAKEVWNDAKNADLKLTRKGEMLLPGDLLFIPDKPRPTVVALTPETMNSYTAEAPRVEVTLSFNDDTGPLKGEACLVSGLSEAEQEMTTDGGGHLKVLVPVHTVELTVTFSKRNVSYRLQVGHLDPPEEKSGLAERLKTLGFLSDASLTGAIDARLQDAVIAFQKANGFQPTGVADEATRTAIIAAHKS